MVQNGQERKEVNACQTIRRREIYVISDTH